MPVIGRTREQIRTSVGYNLRAFRSIESDAAGTIATFITDELSLGGTDEHLGGWLVFTSGTNDGEIRRIVDSSITNNRQTLTFHPEASAATSNGDTAEYWKEEYNPESIHEFINQSIIEATGSVFDPVENVSLHSDGHTLRFDIPSGITVIQDIYYRNNVDFTRLLSSNAAMDEQSTLVATTLDGAISSTSATSVPVDSSTPLRVNQQIMVDSEKMSISSISSNTLTVSRAAGGTTAATHSDGASVLLFPVVDTKIKKQGTASNQFIIPAAASADQIVTDSITSKDISRYDYLEGWIKITRTGEATTTAADLAILLDDTANCASPVLEELDIPALTDDTWTFFRVKLDNPELDTAIISIGLKYDIDLGACTIWLDDIRVVKNDSADWIKLPRNLWNISRQENDIILDEYFNGVASYNLLKLVGGDNPTLLTSDSDSNEIDDQYVIAKTTGLAFMTASASNDNDASQRVRNAAFWLSEAEKARSKFPVLVNARSI
jgi:hypothetical protein